MVLHISGCLEVRVELLRIKGWRIGAGTGCRHQPPLPGSALSAITMGTALPRPVGLKKPALIGSSILTPTPHRKFTEARF